MKMPMDSQLALPGQESCSRLVTFLFYKQIILREESSGCMNQPHMRLTDELDLRGEAEDNQAGEREALQGGQCPQGPRGVEVTQRVDNSGEGRAP